MNVYGVCCGPCKDGGLCCQETSCCLECHFSLEENVALKYVPEHLAAQVRKQHADLQASGFPPDKVREHAEWEMEIFRRYCPHSVLQQLDEDHAAYDAGELALQPKPQPRSVSVGAVDPHLQAVSPVSRLPLPQPVPPEDPDLDNRANCTWWCNNHPESQYCQPGGLCHDYLPEPTSSASPLRVRSWAPQGRPMYPRRSRSVLVSPTRPPSTADINCVSSSWNETWGGATMDCCWAQVGNGAPFKFCDQISSPGPVPGQMPRPTRPAARLRNPADQSFEDCVSTCKQTSNPSLCVSVNCMKFVQAGGPNDPSSQSLPQGDCLGYDANGNCIRRPRLRALPPRGMPKRGRRAFVPGSRRAY